MKSCDMQTSEDRFSLNITDPATDVRLWLKLHFGLNLGVEVQGFGIGLAQPGLVNMTGYIRSKD